MPIFRERRAMVSDILSHSGYSSNTEGKDFDRSLEIYIQSLFFDDTSFWAKYTDNPTHVAFTPADLEQSIKYTKWKAKKPVFGGINHFFSPGAKILDIGSGGGRAVSEINTRFSDTGVRAVGINARYGLQKPIYNDGIYAAADWAQMPFGENSFDRLISQESFPRYLPKVESKVLEVFEEITTVAKPGAIWRGTLPRSFPSNRYQRFERQEDKDIRALVMRSFRECGWETYIFGYVFAARQVSKLEVA